MKECESIVDWDDGCPLEPWEMAFLQSGEEPGPRHSFLFSILYETADWRQRWEAAAEEVLEEWGRMRPSERPVDWIRYLTDIGYLSKGVRDALEEDAEEPLALSA